MSTASRIKLHCNACLGERWHTVLFATQREHVEELHEGDYYHEATKYQLAECNGCEHVTLHTAWTNSGQPTSIEERWPPKISRRQPRWMFELRWLFEGENSFKQDFIREIYSALKAGNYRLAVLGVRALLEQIMIENASDHGNFSKNLEAFEKAGYISRIQREALGPVIEAGHASMHRGFRATETQINAILDVTENVIESIYVAKEKAAGLAVPLRAPSK